MYVGSVLFILRSLGMVDIVFFVIDCFFFFKQKTAYEMRISDWSSDVCSSDLIEVVKAGHAGHPIGGELQLEFLTELIVLVHHRHIDIDRLQTVKEIGSASCRERVCQYV